jgi:hypothetical protein
MHFGVEKPTTPTSRTDPEGVATVGDDLLQWAEVSPIGVGESSGSELAQYAQPLPELPDPRLKKPRSRPNRGRKRIFIGPCLTEPPWHVLRGLGPAYPIPTDLTCLLRVPRSWRSGKAWTAWRGGVFAMWGDQCHLCGHEGADSADHLVPLSVWGNQPYDARLSRPAHGIAGCPTCKVKCNSSRGNRQFASQVIKFKPAIEL